jgi:hypothetical protein
LALIELPDLTHGYDSQAEEIIECHEDMDDARLPNRNALVQSALK